MNPQPTLNSADIELIGNLIDAKITVRLDDFALIVGKGFQDVHQRIDALETKMDKGFERVDRRFDTIDKKLEHLNESKVSYVDHNFLSKRVDKLEEKVE